MPVGPVTDELTWELLDKQPALAPTPDVPRLPLLLFGIHYDTDLVVVSDHPVWTMHEYALVRIGGEEVWFAKDSDGEGVQTITSSRPDLAHVLPEVGVPRHIAPMKVTDLSSGEMLNVKLEYTSPRGEAVEVHFRGPRPTEGTEGRRNSSTMNHSRQVASVVLDVSGKELGSATISFDGVPARIERLAGVPIAASLVQTQGGFALPHLTQTGLNITHGGDDWPTSASQDWGWDGELLTFEGTTYRFDGGLAEAWVEQDGREVAHLTLTGPLPPVPWDGEPVERLFRVDVNGQQHGVGRIRVDGNVLCIAPDAPRWFAERPMQVVLQEEGQVTGSMGCD
jgi:hypothetical protein